MNEIMSFAPLVGGLLAAGALAGLIAGLLGVGGGIVMVPAMALAFSALGYDAGVYHHVAVGTSLAVIITTGFSSARAHHAKQAVMMDVVRMWGPPLVVASLAGGLMARMYSGDLLRAIFGVVALFVAINVILPIQQRLMAQLSESKLTHRISAAIVGYLSALMGIGGGSLSVPTLAAFGNPMRKAVGTGAALGVLIAIPGAIGFVVSGWDVAGRPPFSLGYVNLPAFALIGIVATIVAPYGAKLAHSIDQKRLKQAFAVFLFIVAGRMLYQAFVG